MPEELPPALATAIALAVDEGSEDAFVYLAQQLQHATAIEVMVPIALAFRAANRAEYLPLVIEKLRQPGTRGYRAQLVYACDAFDCTPYFRLFVDLALHDTAHVSWYAIDAVGEMTMAAIPPAELDQAIADCGAYLQTHGTAGKGDGVKRLLTFLRQHRKQGR